MELHTLGRFGLYDGDPDASATRIMGPAKPLALLAFLAMSAKHRAGREQLIGLLWSDVDQDRARSTLRQTVWSLRQRLGENALRADGDDIILASPMSVDAARFQQAVADGALTTAWELYRGAFIPDFGVAGGVGFEQWADLQRDRLRAAWLAVGMTLSRQHLEAQRPREAAIVTRRLLDDCPDRVDVWEIRLEALLLDGDRVQAMADADTVRTMLQEEGQRPGGRLKTLLDRTRRALEPPVAPAGPRRPDLIGREKAFGTLLHAWKTSSRGVGMVYVLRGAAGLGKTRLLMEFRRRAEDLEAVVVLVRTRPSDRDVPYALASSMAQALAECPGAAGVASASASVLVDLAPTLSNTFPRAERAPSNADDTLRLRTLALSELLHVVGEESPIILIVEDVHWADVASRQLLSSLSERIGASAVLLVASLRPSRGAWSTPPGAVVIDLPPLTAEQLEQMLSSLAEGHPALLSELGRALLQASAGVPLLVIAAIDLALERQWLQIVQDQWVCASVEQLRLELARESVLEQFLRELPVDGLSVMLMCALAGRPVSMALLGAASDTRDVESVVSAMELRGLLVRTGDRWEPAHDALADAALDMATAEQRTEVGRRLGHALLREPEPAVRTLQAAGRLLAASHDDDASRCFRRWMHASARRRYWRDPLLAASVFLGDGASVEQARRLLRGLPATSRLVNGYPAIAAALVLFAVGGGGGLVALQAQRWLEPTATRMQLTEPPSSRGFLWDSTAMQADWTLAAQRIPVPLRVSFVDAKGNPSRRTPARVRVRLSDIRGTPQLDGALDQPVVNGEVDFRDLVVRGAGTFRLHVEAGALPAAESRRYYVTGGDDAFGPQRVDVVRGLINGQVIDSTRRTVRIEVGEVLKGTITIRTMTESRTAAMFLGAVATWGDHRAGWLRLAALPPHGEDVLERELVDVLDGRTLRAPSVPGTYHVLLVQDSQTEMSFIASRTHWMLQTPRWNDGDDLADLDAAALTALDRTGRTRWPRLVPSPDGTRDVAHSQDLLVGTVLTVIVQ